MTGWWSYDYLQFWRYIPYSWTHTLNIRWREFRIGSLSRLYTHRMREVCRNQHDIHFIDVFAACIALTDMNFKSTCKRRMSTSSEYASVYHYITGCQNEVDSKIPSRYCEAFHLVMNSSQDRAMIRSSPMKTALGHVCFGQRVWQAQPSQPIQAAFEAALRPNLV